MNLAKNYSWLSNWLIGLIPFVLFSCMPLNPNKVEITLKHPTDPKAVVAIPFNVTVSNIQVANNQVIITGTNLTNVSQFKLKDGTTNFDLQIESKNSTTLIANTINNVSFAAGKIFDFILSNASASSTFTVNFSLCDSTLGGKAFACALTPVHRDVLSYNSSTGKWEPRSVNGLAYQGVFSALAGSSPTAVNIGDYYIISVAGTVGITHYNVGDWIVLSGVGDWEKIDNSSAVTSVFGRAGTVVAVKNDYSLGLMSDVNLTTPVPVANQSYLKWNGTNWVAAAVTETDPSVSAFAKTSLPTCGAGQVLKSDGTTLTCVTDATGAGAFTGSNNVAIMTNGSGGLTSSTVTSTELGYVGGVTSSIQTQLNAKSASAGSSSITTVGTIASGTWNGTVVDMNHGGTGANITGTTGGIPYFNSTSTMATSSLLLLNGIVLGGGSGSAPGTIGLGTSGQFLTSAGVGGPPTWTSTLPIANGGTGASSTSQNFVFAGPTSGSGAPSFRALVAGDLPAGVSSNLSGLTAASAINTIDNLLNAQTWNWSTATTQSPLSITANGLTTGSLLNLTTSNALVNSTNGLLNVTNSGASTNGILARLQSNSTAGSGMTVLANGNVGVGTTAPLGRFQVIPSGETSITNSALTTIDNYSLGALTTSGTQDYTSLHVQGHLGAALNLWTNSNSLGAQGGVKFAYAPRSTTNENTATLAEIYAINSTTDSTSGGSLVLLTRPTSGALTARMLIDPNGYVGIGTTGPGSTLDVKGTLRLSGATSGFVGLAPAAVAGGATYTFPAAVPVANSGYYLTSDTLGNLTWASAGGSAISTLTGDVTASGTGSVAAAVAAVGGSTAADVHGAELLANAATTLNTASTIVKRDASGNFTAGTITANLTGNATNVTGTVAVANGGTGATTLTSNGVLLGNTTRLSKFSSSLRV